MDYNYEGGTGREGKGLDGGKWSPKEKKGGTLGSDAAVIHLNDPANYFQFISN